MKISIFIGCLALLAASFSVSAESLQSNLAIVKTDVCSVLKTPDKYVNQVIRLRGLVYLGEDHLNESSMECPGQGIELVIRADASGAGGAISHRVTKEGSDAAGSA